jgi:ABC-type transport system substrate-binding protein
MLRSSRSRIDPRNSRKRRALAALVVVALALTGCSGNSGGATGGPSGTEDVANRDPAAIYRFSWSQSPTTFDPDKITSGVLETFAYPVYDTLVMLNPKGELVPMLAKSWEVLDGGKALQLSLIENWKFHDGTPFNAAAVKAKIERSQTLEGSTNKQALASITSVEAVDDHTVKLNIDGPAAPLLGALATRAGMMLSPAVFDKPDLDIKPAGGSGMFEVTENVKGSKVVYKAVENYWDPDALLVAGLEIGNFGDDAARLNALTRGNYQHTHLRTFQIQEAEAAGLVVNQDFPFRTHNLYLNTSRSKFSDLRVRQAVNHAIDRDAIAKGLYEGYCEPIAQQLPESHWAHNPDVKGDYFAYDPAKAKSLLAEAGLPNGFTIDAIVLNLELYVSLAEAIQAQLKEIGITMNIRPLAFGEAVDSFTVRKDSDAWVMASQAVPDVSQMTKDFYVPTGSWNPGGFSDPEFTRLHEEAQATLDQEKRAPLYKQLWAEVAKQAAPVVHICTPTGPEDTWKKGVHGITTWKGGIRQFRGVWIEKGVN